MKTLIIGWRRDNIADALAINMGVDLNHELFIPSRKQLDVQEPAGTERYIKANGPFDRIVYTAAVNNLCWIEDITWVAMYEAFTANVFGFINVVARHVQFFPGKQMRVVALVSDAARTPMRGSLLYGSTKTALTGVIRNMARELAPLVTVVGVSPTVVEGTPMTDYIDEAVPKFRGWEPEQAREYEKQNIPMHRRVTKDEVVKTLMFALNGPDMLTGSIIEITGGK